MNDNKAYSLVFLIELLLQLWLKGLLVAHLLFQYSHF